jgi:hypothetical protein
MAYLEGKQVGKLNPKIAKSLIGRGFKYLRRCDIDRTGRGVFFPKYGVIDDVHGRCVYIDGDPVSMSDIVEMVEAPASSPA